MPGEKLGETEVVAPRPDASWCDWPATPTRAASSSTSRSAASRFTTPTGNCSTQGQQQHAGGRRSARRPSWPTARGTARSKAAKWPTSAPTASGSAAAARTAASSATACSTWAPAAFASARPTWPGPTTPNRAATSWTTTTSYDGGHVYPAGIGIWVAQSSDNRISHNDIHDLLYSGMSIGWNWDDAPNRTHDNVIEWNHVHDLGHGVLSDCGPDLLPGRLARQRHPQQRLPRHLAVFPTGAGVGHLPRRHLRQLPGREQPRLQHAQRRADVQQRRPRARRSGTTSSPRRPITPSGRTRRSGPAPSAATSST